MQSNSNSQQSLSNENQHRTRKRIKKLNFKDKDGSYFENSDGSNNKEGYTSKQPYEEDKNEKYTHKRHSSQYLVSDSNNGYLSDEGSSNRTPPRKSKAVIENKERKEANSIESAKPRNKHLELRIRKLDEERVRDQLFFYFETYGLMV